MNRKVFGISLLTGVVGGLVWLAYVFLWQPNEAKPAQVSRPVEKEKAAARDSAVAIPWFTPPSTASQGVAISTADNATLAAIFARMEAALRELAMLYGFTYAEPTQNYAPDDLTYQIYQPQIDNLQQRIDTLKQQANGISTPRTQRFLWEQLRLHGLGSAINYLLFDAIGIPEDNALLEEMLAAVTNTSYPLDDRMALFQGVFLTHGRYYDYSGATGQQAEKTSPQPPQHVRLKQFLEEQFQQETEPLLLSLYLELYYSMIGEGRQADKQQFQQQLELLRGQLGADRYFDFRLRALNLSNANSDYASLLQEIDMTPMTPAERESLMANLGGQLVGFLMPLVYDQSSMVELPARTHQVFQQYLAEHLPQPSLQNEVGLYQYATQMEGIYLLRYGKNAPERLYAYLLNGASLEAQVALLGSSLFQDDLFREKFKQSTRLKQGIKQALTQPNLSVTARSLLENANIRLDAWSTPQPEPEMQGVDENGNPVATDYTGGGNPPDDTGTTPEITPDTAEPVVPQSGY